MIHGRDLILSDSQTGHGHFAAAQTCSVTTKSDFIETCSPTEGAWKCYKPTILSWSASTGHLLASYANYKYFRSMQENKQAVTIRFYDADMQIFYKGQAFIETLDLTGDVNGLAQMKVSLQPSGPLTAAPTTEYEVGTDYNDQTQIIEHDRLWKISLAVDDHDTGGVVYDQIVLTAMRNKVTLRPNRALINCTREQLAQILLDTDNHDLSEKCLLYPTTEGESLIVGPGTYCVIVNYADQDSAGVDYYVMSSF